MGLPAIRAGILRRGCSGVGIPKARAYGIPDQTIHPLARPAHHRALHCKQCRRGPPYFLRHGNIGRTKPRLKDIGHFLCAHPGGARQKATETKKGKTMTHAAEIRSTPNNQSFAGYCLEFYAGGILIAVTGTASPAAELIEADLVSNGYDISRTTEAPAK